jgi:hypothetical protein
VHENRNRSKRFDRGVQRSARSVFCRQVSLNERRPDFRGNLAAALGVDVDNREFRAFSVEGARNAASDSGRDACNERTLSEEQRAQMPRSLIRRTGLIGATGSMAPIGMSGLLRPRRAARAKR